MSYLTSCKVSIGLHKKFLRYGLTTALPQAKLLEKASLEARKTPPVECSCPNISLKTIVILKIWMCGIPKTVEDLRHRQGGGKCHILPGLLCIQSSIWMP